MENTRENKLIFMAQYWGQFIGFDIERGGYPNIINAGMIERTDYINLKTLSLISDEDALIVNTDYLKMTSTLNKTEIFTILFTIFIMPVPIATDRLIQQFQVSEIIALADFIRSKGYALPFMGLSIEELIAYEWVHLIVDK